MFSTPFVLSRNTLATTRPHIGKQWLLCGEGVCCHLIRLSTDARPLPTLDACSITPIGARSETPLCAAKYRDLAGERDVRRKGPTLDVARVKAIRTEYMKDSSEIGTGATEMSELVVA